MYEIGDLYMQLNDKKWELEWCQNDYFACLEIMQDIEYIYGAIQFEIMKEKVEE